MVRLINILKQNLKRPPAVPPQPEPAAERPAGTGELPAENPFRRKDGSASLPTVAETAELVSLYHELNGAVRLTLTGIIHKEKIEQIIDRVVKAFLNHPYNDLLLLAYSSTKGNYLIAHIANDVILSVGFARCLGYEERDLMDIGLAAFSHDLGMSQYEGIAKSGHPLSEQEIGDIKQHPVRSAEMIRPVFGEKIASVVMDVHERENGQGYPRGLTGSGIHLWAKIVAICDTFEALTHSRVFRTPYSPYEAMKIVIKKKGFLFEENIIKRFIEFLSIYPVGSLVYLNSGEVAMVISANPASPTRPVVRVIINEKREVEESRVPADLSEKNFVYISGAVEPQKEKEILHFLNPRGQVEIDEA